MKSALFALILTVCAFAQSAPAPQAGPMQSAPAVPRNEDEGARKARLLLDQCIQALGGDAWLNIQDMEQQGRAYSFYHGQSNSLGILFWRFWKFPDKERIELTKQRDVTYIHNGDKGYEVTYKGTAFEEPAVLADFLRREHHSIETVLREWLRQPGTALFYDGPAIAEQKQAESVSVVNAENDSVTIFLDSHTHLPIKRVFIWRDPVDRFRNEEGEVYDNYRSEQGIMTPHSVIRSRNGEITNQRFVTVVKYNQGLADSMFQASITYDPTKGAPRKK